MAIYAVRRPDESNDRLQTRFKQQVQKKGIVKLVRTRNIKQKKRSQRLQRLRALKREEYRTENRKNKFYSHM